MKWRIGIALCIISVSSLLLFGKPILDFNLFNLFMFFDIVVGSIGMGMMI